MVEILHRAQFTWRLTNDITKPDPLYEQKFGKFWATRDAKEKSLGGGSFDILLFRADVTATLDVIAVHVHLPVGLFDFLKLRQLVRSGQHGERAHLQGQVPQRRPDRVQVLRAAAKSSPRSRLTLSMAVNRR